MDVKVKIKVPIFDEDRIVKYMLDIDGIIDIALAESAVQYIDNDDNISKNWIEIQFKSGISLIVKLSLEKLLELRKQCENDKLKAFMN